MSWRLFGAKSLFKSIHITVNWTLANKFQWNLNQNVCKWQPFCLVCVHGGVGAWCSSCYTPLRWRHNDHAGVSNHQPPGCLLNRLFRRKSKKTSKLRVTGLCAGNSPGTGEFSAQMASYAENVSIWWRHHATLRGPEKTKDSCLW